MPWKTCTTLHHTQRSSVYPFSQQKHMHVIT